MDSWTLRCIPYRQRHERTVVGLASHELFLDGGLLARFLWKVTSCAALGWENRGRRGRDRVRLFLFFFAAVVLFW